MQRLQTVESAAHALNELITFHEEMSARYGVLAGISTQPLSVLLLQFMADREKKAAETLEKYETTAPHSVLNTWLKVPIPESIESFLDSIELDLTPDLAPEQVYDLCNRVDNYVADLLSVLHEGTNVPEIKTVFEDLIQSERNENIALSKAYNSLREF